MRLNTCVHTTRVYKMPRVKSSTSHVYRENAGNTPVRRVAEPVYIHTYIHCVLCVLRGRRRAHGGRGGAVQRRSMSSVCLPC